MVRGVRSVPLVVNTDANEGVIKRSLEDTSELRRVEKSCDWKGEGSRGDVK